MSSGAFKFTFAAHMLKKQFFLYHLPVILGFMLIPFIFLAGDMFSFHEGFHNPYDWFTIVSYLFLLVFFYVNFYWLIPAFYLPKYYLRYIASLVAGFLILFTLYYMIDGRHHHPPPRRPHGSFMKNALSKGEGIDEEGRERPRFNSDSFRRPPPVVKLTQLFFLFMIGIFVTLYIRVKKNMDMIEEERNNAAISYLKSQINPHFLFNTFNSIYSLAIKEGAERTANGMLMLSGMMRYVVSESSSDFVKLEKEISYINDYIELQRLRLDKSVKLYYSMEGNTDDKRIAPLLLIPFIENAFKHGVNPDENSDIRIQISFTGDELNLLVENNKVTINHDTHEKMGFGIENTTNRLLYLYPSAHQLRITDTTGHYKVHLKLKLL